MLAWTRRGDRVLAVALLVVLALAIGSLATAHAAGLTLLAPQVPSHLASARCAAETVTVTPTGTATNGTYTQVRVSGVGDGCATGAVRVASGASGAWTQSFVSTAANVVDGTFTATGAAFTPPTTANGRAYVVVDGWPVPATWEYAPASGPVSPGGGTVMTDIEWTLVTNNPVQVCFVATVTTTSSTPVPWSLEMDLTQAPFNGATSGFQVVDMGQNIAWKLGITYDKKAMTATVAGLTNVYDSVATISSATTLRFKVCNWSLPAGVQTPSAYTVTYANSPAWTSTQACVTATVTGNGTSQFYFAWTIELDMSAARAAVGQFNGWSNPTNNQWMLDRNATGSSTFRFTSNAAANLSGTQSFVFTYCATGR